MGALAVIASDTVLDCVVFKLTTTRTRCEVYVLANGICEKLATGLLKPFLSHIRAAEEQIANGAHTIKLEPRKVYGNRSSGMGARRYGDGHLFSWFSRGTVDRVIRFVSTPHILERIISIDVELAQLDEALRLNLEEAYFASDKVYHRMDASISDSYEGGSISSSGHGPSSPTRRAISPVRHSRRGSRGGSSPVDVELEETGELARHRRKALEVRRSLLRREQGLAFARATAAGFVQETMPPLAAFAECFGANRLREASAKFSALLRRKEDGAVEPARLPNSADSVVGQVGSHSVAGDEDTYFSDSRSDSGSSLPALTMAVQTDPEEFLPEPKHEAPVYEPVVPVSHVPSPVEKKVLAEKKYTTPSPPKSSKKPLQKWRAATRKAGAVRRVVVIKKILVMQDQASREPVHFKNKRATATDISVLQHAKPDYDSEEAGSGEGHGTWDLSPIGLVRRTISRAKSPFQTEGRDWDKSKFSTGAIPDESDDTVNAIADVSTGRRASGVSDLDDANSEHYKDKLGEFVKKAWPTDEEKDASEKEGECNDHAIFEEPDLFYTEPKHRRVANSQNHRTYLWEDEYRGPLTNSEHASPPLKPISVFPVVEPSLLLIDTSPKRQRIRLAMQEDDFRGPNHGAEHSSSESESGVTGESNLQGDYLFPRMLKSSSYAADASAFESEQGMTVKTSSLHEDELRGPEATLKAYSGSSLGERNIVMDMINQEVHSGMQARTDLLEDEFRGPSIGVGVTAGAYKPSLDENDDQEPEIVIFSNDLELLEEREKRYNLREPEDLLFEAESRFKNAATLQLVNGPDSQAKDGDEHSDFEKEMEPDWADVSGKDGSWSTLKNDTDSGWRIASDDFVNDGNWVEVQEASVEQVIEDVGVLDEPQKESKAPRNVEVPPGKQGRLRASKPWGSALGALNKSRENGTRAPEDPIVAEAQQRAQERLRIRQMEAAKRKEEEKKKQEEAKQRRLGRIASKVGMQKPTSDDSGAPSRNQPLRNTGKELNYSPLDSGRSSSVARSRALASDSADSLSRSSARSPSPRLRSSLPSIPTPRSPSPGARDSAPLASRSVNMHKSLPASSFPTHAPETAVNVKASPRGVSSPSSRLLSPTAATLHREASVVASRRKGAASTNRKRRTSDPRSILNPGPAAVEAESVE